MSQLSITNVIGNLLKDSKYLLLINISERISYLIIYIILSRSIPKAEYGLLVTIIAVANIMNAFFDFGLPFYVQRGRANSQLTTNIFSQILFIKFLCLPFFILTLFVYFTNLLSQYIGIISIVVSAIFLAGTNSVLNAILYGDKNYNLSAKLVLISRTVLILLFLIFVILGFELQIIVSALLISAVLHFILLIKSLSDKRIVFWGNKFQLRLIGTILKSSFPIGIGVLFVLFYDRVDIIIIDQMIGIQNVAIYAVSYSIFRSSQLFSSIFLMPAFTNFSESFVRNGHLNYLDVKSVFLVLMIVCSVIVSIFYVFPDFIIDLLFGGKYIESVVILKYLSFGLFGVFLNNLTGVISNSINRVNIPVWGTGVGVVTNIVLNIILISCYGVIGAVVATVVTEFVVFFVQAGRLVLLNRLAVFIK